MKSIFAQGNPDIVTINQADKLNVYGGVATFNADPFAIENEETIKDVLDSIKNEGVQRITDPYEYLDAAAKLDLDTARNLELALYKNSEMIICFDL